jgi:WhiB family transcriptional regulator, redox-sensing transcriptional regulator
MRTPVVLVAGPRNGEGCAVRSETSRGHPRLQEARQAALSEDWEWQRWARCRGLPTEMFFASDHAKGMRRIQRERHAKQVCLSCPVVEHCRSYAIDAGERYGIWGATTPLERHRLTRGNSCRF